MALYELLDQNCLLWLRLKILSQCIVGHSRWPKLVRCILKICSESLWNPGIVGVLQILLFIFTFYSTHCFPHVCLSLCPSLLPTDIPHDLWPGQRCDANHKPNWYDAPAVSLGRLSAVPGPHAAGLSVRLLGLPQQDGGRWTAQCVFVFKKCLQVTITWPWACKVVWQKPNPHKAQKRVICRSMGKRGIYSVCVRALTHTHSHTGFN